MLRWKAVVDSTGIHHSLPKAIGSTIPRLNIDGWYNPSKYGWFIAVQPLDYAIDGY